MVLEHEPLPFDQWLSQGLQQWLVAMGALALVALILGFILTAVFNGPGKAGDMIYRLVVGAVKDLVGISPRRVLALARLAVQESLRRRVLAGLGVFIVILAFAIWFLDARTPDPAKLYLSFVLTATTWLVLLMMVFLSAFSLPNDIKNHTIYTIVTKPVRASEIVLGRIVGFGAMGTALLVIMGIFSYFFVVRALNHTHELSARDLTEVTAQGAAPGERVGRTGLTRNHRHPVTLFADGSGSTDTAQGHWHDVTVEGSGENQRLTVGPPQGQFHARVPIYGKLSFTDRAGQPAREGINVGNEWTYRSYIEGASRQIATWNFSGIRREDFPDGLRLNMTISVFRTHKGNIEQTVVGSYTLRNPRTGVSAPGQNFFAKEFAIDDRMVPETFEDANGKTLDLFEDLIDEEGNLEIELACLQGGQYFGMAQPDLYLLPREGSFEANFVKGYIGIWQQMLLITTFGVMWSTFLNGSVAMLATLMTLIAGQFAPWVQELASGTVIGGNTFEAAFRIVTQTSISTPLDENLTSTVVQGLDAITLWPLRIVASLLPDFGQLDDTGYVAEGFNIPTFVIAEHSLAVLGFLIPLFIIGYLCLKTREVAK